MLKILQMRLESTKEQKNLISFTYVPSTAAAVAFNNSISFLVESRNIMTNEKNCFHFHFVSGDARSGRKSGAHPGKAERLSPNGEGLEK